MIEEINIGQIIFDKDGSECKVTNKTTTSLEVFIKAKKIGGIDCFQWVDFKDRFIKRFKYGN